MTIEQKSPKFSAEVRERAVQMVFAHRSAHTAQWAAIQAALDRRWKACEFATLEWVDWFNNRRLLELICRVPPAEAEAAYYASLEVPAKIAT